MDQNQELTKNSSSPQAHDSSESHAQQKSPNSTMMYPEIFPKATLLFSDKILGSAEPIQGQELCY